MRGPGFGDNGTIWVERPPTARALREGLQRTGGSRMAKAAPKKSRESGIKKLIHSGTSKAKSLERFVERKIKAAIKGRAKPKKAAAKPARRPSAKKSKPRSKAMTKATSLAMVPVPEPAPSYSTGDVPPQPLGSTQDT